MTLARLTYISENQLDRSMGSPLNELSAILSAANRNNKPRNITGALIFDDMWFLQALEGDRKVIWERFEALREDTRHANLTLLELKDVPERIFGNWWMGLAVRSPETEYLFAPFTRNGLLAAEQMTASDVLDLMKALTRFGLRRALATTDKVQ